VSAPRPTETGPDGPALAPPPGEERLDLRDGRLVEEGAPEADHHERSEFLQRIYLFIRMRWYGIVALLLTLMVVTRLGGFQYSEVPPVIVLIAMAMYNVLFEIDFHYRERHDLGVAGFTGVYRTAIIQIDLDLIALTALIHFTGGIDSPFVLFYIFHTITASYLLSRAETFKEATLAVWLFATMCYLEYLPVPIEALDWQLLQHVSLYDVGERLNVARVLMNYENPQYIMAFNVALAAILFVSAAIGTHLAQRYRRSEERIHELAITDGLTGLFNYRHFSEQLEVEFERARRYRHKLALIMIDMDGLKAFNDVNGHLLGSQALKEIADILKGSTRAIDVVSKYGGDEFAMVLPETDKQGASFIAERIRHRVREHRFMMADRKRTGILSVSGGVSIFPDDATALRELVDVADNCLYEAKQAGRNRIKVANTEGFMGGETDGMGRDGATVGAMDPRPPA